MSHGSNAWRSALWATAAGMAVSTVAYAQTTRPSGELASELNRYAAAAGVEILFEPEVVANKRSAPFTERSTPGETLQEMLGDTGLTFHEVGPSLFVIRRVGDSPEHPPGQRSQTDPATGEPVQLGQSEPAGRRAGDLRDGALQGEVVDQRTGGPLVGVLLRIPELGLETSTDRRGAFRFPAAAPGEYAIEVDYLGLDAVTRVVTIEPGQTTSLDLSLQDDPNTITVVAARSSLAQALNQQRAADNSSTVVSSDLLGSFPAENVAEALRRVPGAAFDRDESSGEGSRISVRGFNSEAINVQLNGLQLQGTGIERSVDLTGIQGDNIANIVIQKSLLPSHEATGTGGLIEIETRSGLDYGERYFSVGFEDEFGEDDAFGGEWEGTATAAWQFTPDFGVVAMVTYRDTDRTNYDLNHVGTNTPVLPFGVTNPLNVPESFDFPFDPELPDRLLTGSNVIARDREETNLTASLNFAWDIEDHTRLRFDVQRIERSEHVQMRRSTQSFLPAAVDMPVPELGGEIRRRTYISSLRPTLGIDEQDTDETLTVLGLRGETSWNRWDFEYKVGYTEVVRERNWRNVQFLTDANTNVLALIDPATLVIHPDDDAAATPRVVDGGVVIVGDNIPVLSLSEAGLAFVNSPSTYYVLAGTRAEARNPAEEYTGEFSSRYTFASRFLQYLETGVKYTSGDRENSDDILSNTTIQNWATYNRIVGRNTYLSDLSTDGLQMMDLGVIGADPFALPMVAPGSLDDMLDQIAAWTVDDPTTPFNEQRFNAVIATDDPILDPNAYAPATTSEDRFAWYVEGKATWRQFDLIGGFRYEALETNGNTLSTPSIRTDSGFEPRLTFINAGLIHFQDVGGPSSTLTPSLIANYRPTDNIVYRFAYFRSTINPDIRLINRPSQLVLDLRTGFNTAIIREANPDLDPTITHNFDVDAAYYFTDSPGLVRIGLFYKDVSNNFTNVLIADEQVGDDLAARVTEALAPLVDTRPDLVAIDADTQFFLSRPENGAGGVSYGVELELIRQLTSLPESWPDFLSNFTVLGNLTWTQTDFPTDVAARNDLGQAITLTLDRPLSNQSEWTGNASISYTAGGFDGRLIYSYQSESVVLFDEYNLNVVKPEFETLDLRLSYTLERPWGRASFFFEGDNLLLDSTEADIRSGTGSAMGDGSPYFFFPSTVQFSGGRTFTVGARISY